MTDEAIAELHAQADELARMMADPKARERFRREAIAEARRRMPHMTEAQIDAQWGLALQLFG